MVQLNQNEQRQITEETFSKGRQGLDNAEGMKERL